MNEVTISEYELNIILTALFLMGIDRDEKTAETFHNVYLKLQLLQTNGFQTPRLIYHQTGGHTVIIFGSEKANTIVKDSYQQQQEEAIGLYLEDALEIATRINLDGRDLAEWFINAVDLTCYEHLEAFMALMVEYATDNSLMPQAYYDLVKFRDRVTAAVNGEEEDSDD